MRKGSFIMGTNIAVEGGLPTWVGKVSASAGNHFRHLIGRKNRLAVTVLRRPTPEIADKARPPS